MERGLTKKRAFLMGIVTLFIMVLSWCLICQRSVKKLDETIIYNDGWTLSFNGEVTEKADISEITFKTHAGDEIILSHEISDEVGTGYTAILRTFLASVVAYVDDVKIYDYSSEKINTNKFIGSAAHFISIPEKSAGKTLTIHIVIHEDDAMSDIKPVRFEKTGEAVRNFAYTYAAIMYINCFIIIFGLVLVAAGFLITHSTDSSVYLTLVGGFTFLIGVWSNCQSRVYEIIFTNYTEHSVIEYLTLYCAGFVFLMFILKLRGKRSEKKYCLMCAAVAMVGIFIAVSSVLHFTNVAHYSQTLMIFHLLTALGLAVMLYAGLWKYKSKTASDRLINVALMVLSMSCVFDLLRFNMQKIFFPGQDTMLEISFIPIGVILFLVYAIAGYVSSLYDKIITNVEKETLTRLAYHDTLTGLYNRAKMQETFDILDRDLSPIAIVSYDVNGLKYVNDSFGHDAGDKLLTTVSSSIEECFNEIGTNFRLSGDEFMTIVSSDEITVVAEAINKFEHSIKEKSNELPYRVSVSYGISFRHAQDTRTTHEVYKEADEKMYKMKMKSEFSRHAIEEHLARISADDNLSAEGV